MLVSQRTTVKNIVYCVCAIDAANQVLLPASFKALSLQMNVGPQQLGCLAFAQSISFAFALPIWGSLIRVFTHRDLMTAGCLLWGSATLALCSSTSYEVHVLLRLVIGFGLAVVNPIGQAILCDVVPEAEQGWAFGVLGAVSCLVSIVVSGCTTSIAASTIIGIKGWQLAYAVTAMLSLFMAIIVHFCVPSNLLGSSSVCGRASKSWLQEQREIFSSVMSKPSFFIMVAQGVTGGIPWNAFAFLPLFLQSSGYSDLQAGMIIFWGGAGAIVGNPLGGFLGDFFNRMWPNAGRCAVAQMSVLLGTGCFLLFMYAPQNTQSIAWVMSLYGLFQVVCCWTQAAALRPICGTIVKDSKERAQVLSLWIALEGLTSAAFGAPLVGLLSLKFGYALDSMHGDSPQEANMIAIRKALVSISFLCWTLCFLAWVPMYWTYPRDRDRLAECSIQQSYGSVQKLP